MGAVGGLQSNPFFREYTLGAFPHSLLSSTGSRQWSTLEHNDEWVTGRGVRILYRGFNSLVQRVV